MALLREAIGHLLTPLINRNADVGDGFAAWDPLLLRFALAETPGPGTRAPFLVILRCAGIRTPEAFGALPLPRIRQLPRPAMRGRRAILWQAARLGDGPLSASPAHLDILPSLPDVSPRFSSREPSAESSAFGATFSDLRARIGLSTDFETLGPVDKPRRLSGAALDSRILSRFLDAGAHVSVLQQVRSSVPSLAAGPKVTWISALLETWALFLRRQPSCADGARSFARVGLLHIPLTYREGIPLLGIGAAWRTPAIRAAVLGLVNMLPTRPLSRNIISIDYFSRFNLRGPLSSEFGRLGYLAFIFVLRLQSEALPMVRAPPGDPLLSRTPQRHKSLIGLHMVGDDVRLALNHPIRKYTRNVTISARPCFCAAGGVLPLSLCPIRGIWAALVSHTPPASPYSRPIRGVASTAS